MCKVIMSHKKEIEICQIFDLYIGRKHLKSRLIAELLLSLLKYYYYYYYY